MDYNFKEWFLSKREPSFAGSLLNYGIPPRFSVHRRIITGLGGPSVVETTLGELFWLMKVQKPSECGPLLINYWSNIFYIPDINEVLRAVRFYVSVTGWYLDADDISGRWFGRGQVFFRNYD